MKLTEEGQALLQYVHGTRELEGQFQSLIQGKSRNEVSLRIIGPTSAISTRVVKEVEPLYRKFPYLKLHLQSDDFSNRVEMIRRGEADLAIVPPGQVPNEMASKVLRSDRYLLLGSSQWKGRRLSEMLETERVIDFYESDETTFNYLKEFSLRSKRERIFINGNDALIRMLIAGIGFGTLTETVALPYLQSGQLITLNRGQAVQEPLALVWYPRPTKMDYFEQIIHSIK